MCIKCAILYHRYAFVIYTFTNVLKCMRGPSPPLALPAPPLELVSCWFGPNPSCRPASPQRRSNTVFPLNQMKKVKRRTWLPEPEGSARTPRTSHFFPPVIQHNKGATSVQEIITTSTLNDYVLSKTHRVHRVQNNNDAFVVQSSLRRFKYLLSHHTCERGPLDYTTDCKQYLTNNTVKDPYHGICRHGTFEHHLNLDLKHLP